MREREPVTPTLLERADEVHEYRHRRYAALFRYLVDDTDKEAAKELAEAEKFLAGVDQKAPAAELRQERESLVAEYARRIAMLEQRMTDPPESDVAAGQMAKNQARHGHYVRDRDLQLALDGQHLTGIEGIHFKRIRPQSQAQAEAQARAALTTGEDVERGA